MRRASILDLDAPTPGRWMGDGWEMDREGGACTQGYGRRCPTSLCILSGALPNRSHHGDAAADVLRAGRAATIVGCAPSGAAVRCMHIGKVIGDAMDG